MPIILLAMLLLGGLVVDGGRDLALRGRAQAYAEEAARAGATQVRLGAADLQLDEHAAIAKAQEYCNTILAEKRARVLRCAPDQTLGAVNPPSDMRQLVVTVRVTLQIDTTLLSLLPGVTTMEATGVAKARPYEGLTPNDAR
jgi:Flp pilus assembly protein TadG